MMLQQKLRKDLVSHPVAWTEKHSEILAFFLEKLISPPVMGFPHVNLPFILHSDASQNGLGAVLYKKQGKGIKIIAFASRTLSPYEKGTTSIRENWSF